MSAEQKNAGGPAAIRGYLVQTLVALLDIAQADPPFSEITLEPAHADEQFDFVWSNAQGAFAVQVKSTINAFSKGEVESWAAKLQAARKSERCRLILVGNFLTSMKKVDRLHEVEIEKKYFDLSGMKGYAAHQIDKFMRAHDLGSSPPEEREKIVNNLISHLLDYSVTREPLTRDAFIKLLTGWIKDEPEVSKYYGKRRKELRDYFVSDWLHNGPPVAILQGFPGCGKSELATEIAAHAPHRLEPLEPQFGTEYPSFEIMRDLAFALDREGIPDLLEAPGKEADSNLFNTLLEVLRRHPVLIIVDEFQRLLSDKDELPPADWQRLVEKLNHSALPAGRLLLISNRTIKNEIWCEKCANQELRGLEVSEAVLFLNEQLESKNTAEKVPVERREEICRRMDGNPRALKTLVDGLLYDSLDDLLSLAPDGDVELDSYLVEEFERKLIQRTLSRMEGELLKFMRCMAVHRLPFKKEAFAEFPSAQIGAPDLRRKLIDRFLLSNNAGGDSMHPLAREISVTRLRDEKTEWKQAHSLAANYHFRHFKAIQMTGIERCTASYAELRHHLFEAGRIDELYLASEKLAQFTLAQIPKSTYSQIPSSTETIEERIALISALPEGQRPRGLEYHLALCLKHRNLEGDYQKALFHARRGVGPNVYYAAWLLLIELEYSLNGVDAMLKAMDRAIQFLGNGSNVFAVYHLSANLLSKANKLDAAINVLEKGMSTHGVECVSSLASICSSYMEQAGRGNDAIELLKKCIDTPNMPELWKVYEQCAKLMVKMKRSGDAVMLLKKGVAIPGNSSSDLYMALAKLLVNEGKDADAISMLKDGISDERLLIGKDTLYCFCSELLAKGKRVDEALALLENGISSRLIKDPVSLYHKYAAIMEESGNANTGVKFLKGAMSHPVMSLEPSIYLVCAKQLFHSREIDDAISVLKRGLLVSKLKDKDQLYKMCAELIVRQGRLDEAIVMLETGIADKGAQNKAYLYQISSELLDKAGRIDDAIEVLKKGIAAPALANKVVLFQACAKLLNKAGRMPEAIQLLQKGIRLPGMTGHANLYRTCAELMAKAGRHEEAIQLLQGAFDGPKIGNLASLYQLCAKIMVAAKQQERANSTLLKGMKAYPDDKNLRLFYEGLL